MGRSHEWRRQAFSFSRTRQSKSSASSQRMGTGSRTLCKTPGETKSRWSHSIRRQLPLRQKDRYVHQMADIIFGGRVRDGVVMEKNCSLSLQITHSMSVSINNQGSRFVASTPRPLFRAGLSNTVVGISNIYDVSRDGKRFIFSFGVLPESNAPITLSAKLVIRPQTVVLGTSNQRSYRLRINVNYSPNLKNCHLSSAVYHFSPLCKLPRQESELRRSCN